MWHKPPLFPVKKNYTSKVPSVAPSTLCKSKYLSEASMPIVSNSAANDLITSTCHTGLSITTKENAVEKNDGKKIRAEINCSKNYKIKMNVVNDEMLSRSTSDLRSTLQPPVPVNKPLRPSLNKFSLGHGPLNGDSNAGKIDPHMLSYSSYKPLAPISTGNDSSSSVAHSSFMLRGCATDMNETMNDPTKFKESEEDSSISDRQSSFRSVARQSSYVSPMLSLSTSPTSPNSSVTKLKPTSISVSHFPTDALSRNSDTLRHSCPTLSLSLTPKLGNKSLLGSQNIRVGENTAPCLRHDPCISMNARPHTCVNTHHPNVSGNHLIVSNDFSDNFIAENQER